MSPDFVHIFQFFLTINQKRLNICESSDKATQHSLKHDFLQTFYNPHTQENRGVVGNKEHKII